MMKGTVVTCSGQTRKFKEKFYYLVRRFCCVLLHVYVCGVNNMYIMFCVVLVKTSFLFVVSATEWFLQVLNLNVKRSKIKWKMRWNQCLLLILTKKTTSQLLKDWRNFISRCIPYVINIAFQGESFVVGQQCSLCKDNFHCLPMITDFSVLIISRKIQW